MVILLTRRSMRQGRARPQPAPGSPTQEAKASADPRASACCQGAANLLPTRPAGLASSGDVYVGNDASVLSNGSAAATPRAPPLSAVPLGLAVAVFLFRVCALLCRNLVGDGCWSG
jgi:hypothetical protein